MTERLYPIDAGMCSLLTTSYEAGACLELLLSKGSLWRIRSEQRRKIVQDEQPNMTLLDVLDRAKRLSLKDRLKLAVVLATALLHLKDSRWLADDWTKRSVAFMMLNGAVDVCRPYLASTFPSHAALAVDQPDLNLLHPSPALLGLGIMLLEIGMSTPIEQARSEEELVSGNISVNTDLFTAIRVLEQSEGDLHVKYRAAVHACLRCHFVPMDAAPDFDDEEIRRLVYVNVVQPLEMDLYEGWGVRPDDLWIHDPIR